MKTGTEIVPKNDLNDPLTREVAYYGKGYVVYALEGREHAVRRETFDAEFTERPKRFETGNTYESNLTETQYHVEYANDDAAFVSWGNHGEKFYGHIYHHDYDGYTEVKGNG